MKVAPLPRDEALRLQSLHEAGILDTLPSAGFDDIARVAAAICDTPVALVAFLDEDRNWFKARVGIDLRETPRSVSFCSHAILGREVFEVPDAHADERFADNPFVVDAPGVRFYAGAPLVDADDRALGTLCVVDARPRTLTGIQKSALSALARQVMAQVTMLRHSAELLRAQQVVAEANENLRATVARLETRDRVLRLLNEMGDVLQCSRTDEEIQATITDFAERIFGEESGVVFTLDDKRTEAAPIARWGTDMESGEGIAPEDCWAIRRGRTHHSRVGRGVRCPHVGEGHPHLCVPMLAEGQVRGTLQVRFAHERQAEEQAHLVEAMAERLGLAMANFRLRDSLRFQSLTDPLTGLSNRRYVDTAIARELARCARHGRPFTLLLLDIDHFKRINDTCGHDAGDEVLRRVARLLRSSVRTEDIVCRYGGEEFLVGFMDGSVAGCAARADALRKEIAELDVAHDGKAIGRITISIGLSAAPADGTTHEALIAAADRALYRAKAEGRDRVVTASPVPALPPEVAPSRLPLARIGSGAASLGPLPSSPLTLPSARPRIVSV